MDAPSPRKPSIVSNASEVHTSEQGAAEEFAVNLLNTIDEFRGASDEDDLRTQATATIDAGIRLAKEAAAGKGLVELRQLFDTLDVDHDGKVTGQEWGKKVKQNQALLAKYFGGSTLKEIGSAFKRIDKDGDASLTWEEFVDAAGLKLVLALQPVVQTANAE